MISADNPGLDAELKKHGLAALSALPKLPGLPGLRAPDVPALSVVQDGKAVGINCSPLSAVGTVGSSCATQPVCCEDNTSEHGVSLGCEPVNISI